MSDDAPQKPNRIVAVAIAFVAAAALGYAAFTHMWLVPHHEDYGFGLREYYACEGSTCNTESNSSVISSLKEAGGRTAELSSNAFPPLGWATFVECLLAALGLVGGAAIALTKKTPQLPMSPSTLALLGIMAALVTGCVFVAIKPGEAGYVGVGQSFWVFGGGAVLGLVGAIMLARVNRPSDPDLMKDAMNPDEF